MSQNIMVCRSFDLVESYKNWLESQGATKQESFAYAQGLQDFLEDPKTVDKFFAQSYTDRGPKL